VSSVRGKVAVVTGAGSGIGRGLALGLAARGARLSLADIDEARLAETAELARRLGGEVHTARVDVSERAAVTAYAAEVVSHFGVVHQVYNNAGIAVPGASVVECRWADYERVLAVNLWGVIHGTKAFLPHLVASGDGHLVNISSLDGIMAQAGMSAYSASKFAVRGFTESVRGEMLIAGLPIQVTVVHPGGVKTNIARAALEEAERRGMRVSARNRARTRVYEEKLLRMPPDRAARRILDGVEAGKTRILVGGDARLVDLVVRVAPAHYPRLSTWLDRLLFDRPPSTSRPSSNRSSSNRSSSGRI